MAWFSRVIIIVLLCYVPFGAMAQQPATAPTQSLLDLKFETATFERRNAVDMTVDA
jgi:hypothetical protein